MFSVNCPVIGSEVLRGPRSIVSMHNTSDGVVGYFRCQCGTLGVMVTGRLADHTTYYHPGRDAAPIDLPEPAAVGA